MLEFLAGLHAQLISHGRELRSQMPECQISDDLRVCRFASGPWIDGYSEAAWASGNFVVWSVDVARDGERWVVRRSFGREEGQTIVDFDDVYFTTFDEVMAAAPTLVDELLQQRAQTGLNKNG